MDVLKRICLRIHLLAVPSGIACKQKQEQHESDEHKVVDVVKGLHGHSSEEAGFSILFHSACPISIVSRSFQSLWLLVLPVF